MRHGWEWWVSALLFIVADNCTRGQVNNTAPAFSEPFYNVSLPENTWANTFVWEANVTDPDTGPAGQLTYKLEDRTYFIISSTGTLMYLGGLDYERPETRETVLRVTVTDGGSPPKSAEAFIYIHLLDIDDYQPRFSTFVYYPVIVDGSPAGTFLIQMSAEDKDTPVIHYKITVENEFFRIDNLTGVITASQTVNRRLIEDNNRVSFFVTAEDGSVHKALVRIQTRIVDPNLHKPNFTKNPYQASVDEGETGHVTVITVLANDGDPHTPNIRYDIVPGLYSDKFAIDEVTGEITLNGTFDRETLSEPDDTITLLVTATDDGFPPLNSTTTVTVRINDTDDHGPKFDKDLHEMYLTEDFRLGLSFDMPTATDKDTGLNAQIKYRIYGGKDGPLMFNINEMTGRLTTRINCISDCEQLDNSTYVEFFLQAINAANPAIPGDTMLIKVYIETQPTTSPGPNPVPSVEEDPVLSTIEIAVIIVVAALVLLIIFIVIIILVCRRRKTTEKEKVKITPPQNPRPVELKDEVCY